MFFKNRRRNKEIEYIKEEIIKYYATEKGEDSSDYKYYNDLCCLEYDDNGNPYKINFIKPKSKPEPKKQHENSSSKYYSSSLRYYDDYYDDYDDLDKDPRHSCYKYPYNHPYKDPYGYPYSDVNY